MVIETQIQYKLEKETNRFRRHLKLTVATKQRWLVNCGDDIFTNDDTISSSVSRSSIVLLSLSPRFSGVMGREHRLRTASAVFPLSNKPLKLFTIVAPVHPAEAGC